MDETRYTVEENTHYYVKDNETGQYLYDGTDKELAVELAEQLKSEMAIRDANEAKLAAGEPLVVDVEDSVSLSDNQ